MAKDDIAFKLAIFKLSLHLSDNTGFCSIIQVSESFFWSLLAKNNFFVQFWTKNFASSRMANYGSGGIVIVRVCLCAGLWVCPRVCQPRACPSDNSSPVQTRATKVELGCKITWLRSLLSLLLIDIVKFNLKFQISLCTVCHQSWYTITRVNTKNIFDLLQFFQWRICLVLRSLITHLRWGAHLRGGGTHLYLWEVWGYSSP